MLMVMFLSFNNTILRREQVPLGPEIHYILPCCLSGTQVFHIIIELERPAVVRNLRFAGLALMVLSISGHKPKIDSTSACREARNAGGGEWMQMQVWRR